MSFSMHAPNGPSFPQEVAEGAELLSDAERRAKSACIRCRNRKTKCSGEIPCKRCKSGNFKCEYMRKRKRVSLYDTEIEDYVDKIQALEKEVHELKRALLTGSGKTENHHDGNSSNSSGLSTGKKHFAKDVVANGSDSKNNVDLSVYLGSGSSELVCWNLKRFIMNHKNQVKSQEVYFSPDFNSFIEESVYDYLLSDTSIPSLQALENLTIGTVESLLANVVLFINSGYLTLDPISFRKKLPQYFDANGVFKIERLRRGSTATTPSRTASIASPVYSPSAEPAITDSDYFFLIKIIMICTLGEIYSPECSLGNTKIPKDDNIGESASNSVNFTLSTTPGLQFFKIVIHFLPSIFSTLNLSRKNQESHLDIIELLGLISIYLRCIDKKNLAVMFTINALQMCISMNLHKKSNNTMETRAFWSLFCLNRFFCLRIGKSLLLREDEITTPLPIFDSAQDNQVQSPTSEEFSKSNLMVHYIYLAKIAEQITNEIYCFKPLVVDKNKEYLNSILTIVQQLVDWVSQLPEFLRLRLPLESGNPSNRLVYTLHLNSLHHIYLTCIPILLNLTKLRIAIKENQNKPFDLEKLPKNIKIIVKMCIQSSQLTINLFIALYKENLTRIFGFTDLDYLFSSSLMFIICLILKLPNIEENYTYEEYLQVAINLIGEMKNRGNLVARGKLNQILDLTQSLKNGNFGSDEFDSLYEFIKGYYYNHSNQPTIINLINETEAVKRYEHNQQQQQAQQEQLPSEIATSIQINPPLTATPVHSRHELNNNSEFPLQTLRTTNADTPKDNNNQLLDDFELGKDFTDYSSLTEPLFNGFQLVTEEDMMFMNNIIQDFESMSEYVDG